MNLALFDLDGTLIERDSDHAFGEFMIKLGWVDGPTFRRRNDIFYQQYLAGQLDLSAYIDFATAPWRHRPQDELSSGLCQFMKEVMQTEVRVPALELVQRHQQAGDLVAIVTATHEVITRPLADAFGVEHLIAVRLVRDGQGRVTGAIDGTPSFREGKVARVVEWLTSLGHRWTDFDRTLFYSDSTNDLPLMERVSNPVATNPGPALLAVAKARGWPIMRLFQ